jgi:hypothetical protein
MSNISLLTIANAILTQQLEASKQAQEFSHDNLMILERDRQKAWDKTTQLELEKASLTDEVTFLKGIALERLRRIEGIENE